MKKHILLIGILVASSFAQDASAPKRIREPLDVQELKGRESLLKFQQRVFSPARAASDSLETTKPEFLKAFAKRAASEAQAIRIDGGSGITAAAKALEAANALRMQKVMKDLAKEADYFEKDPPVH